MRIQERQTSESASFLADVEKGLGSISTADRNEMLEELRTHISQLLSEGEHETIREVLGEPNLYAIELIKASGFDVPAQQSRFQRLAKLPTASKVLIGSISAVLVAALGILAHNYQVSSNRNQFEVNQVVADRVVAVPDLVGLSADYAIEVLIRDDVPLCSTTNFRGTSTERLKVTAQFPEPGQAINPIVECVELTFTVLGASPSYK